MKEGQGRAIPYHAMFDAAFRADPYPFYQYLRSTAPVVWDDVLNAWVVTRAADISEVLHRPQDFLSDRVSVGRQRFSDPELAGLFDLIELLMLQSDGDKHVRLRRLASQAFKRTAIDAYTPGVRRLAETLLAPPAAQGTMTFVRDVATPLPVLVISEILGIPSADRDQIKAWCDAFSIVALNFYSKISDEQLRAGRDAVDAFSRYLKEQVAERRGKGGDDLLSALVAAEEQGDRLSFEELVANAILLLNAGNETTSVLLTNAAHILCTRPEIQDRLRAAPELVPNMVEETLRYTPPVHFIGRLVARDLTLGGERLRKGDLVMTFLGAAGRDAEAVDDPEAFRLDRPKTPHLSFGSGPHVCLGLQLARMEAQVTIETLLSRYRSLTLAEDQLEFGPNLNLRCYRELPIAFTV